MLQSARFHGFQFTGTDQGYSSNTAHIWDGKYVMTVILAVVSGRDLVENSIITNLFYYELRSLTVLQVRAARNIIYIFRMEIITVLQ